jgi:hypothetical protein
MIWFDDQECPPEAQEMMQTARRLMRALMAEFHAIHCPASATNIHAYNALMSMLLVEAASGMTVRSGTHAQPGKIRDVATAMLVSGYATAAPNAAAGESVIAEASKSLGQKLLANDLTKAKPKLFQG